MNKVAVIMSVYYSDRLEYLVDAVDSILNQNYRDFILFIYRDGPVPHIMDSYLDDISLLNNVILIKGNANLGLAKALNRLIDFVVSKKQFSFIARMDSDDISKSNRFQCQLDFFEKNPNVDVLGTSCREFGASFALYEKHLPINHFELINWSITRCPFIHPTVMLRISIFEKGYRYPENTKLTEDMAFWFVLLNAGYIFANTNQILLDYRLNEKTILRRKGFNKAISEINVRTINMFRLKKVSLKNIFFISSRIIFHLMPSSLVRLAYKFLR